MKTKTLILGPPERSYEGRINAMVQLAWHDTRVPILVPPPVDPNPRAQAAILESAVRELLVSCPMTWKVWILEHDDRPDAIYRMVRRFSTRSASVRGKGTWAAWHSKFCGMPQGHTIWASHAMVRP